jgi:hypothetical protein
MKYTIYKFCDGQKRPNSEIRLLLGFRFLSLKKKLNIIFRCGFIRQDRHGELEEGCSEERAAVRRGLQ